MSKYRFKTREELKGVTSVLAQINNLFKMVFGTRVTMLLMTGILIKE